MAGNSTLPIYQNLTTSTSASPPSSTSVSSYVASTKAFMGEIAEAGKTVLARQRPWSEVLDKNCFTKPDSIADATSRIKKNLSYFRVNYAVVSAPIVFISLLWHPTILTGLAMGATIVSVHASFRTSDDLFLEEPVHVNQKNHGYQSLTTV